MLMGSHDREAAYDRRTITPLKTVLENQRGLTVRDAIRQRRNWKLRRFD